MAVATSLKNVSTTASSNSPAGTDVIGTTLDDELRQIQATFRAGLAHKGTDIASAATTDLGAVDGLMHDITGTVTITSFGAVSIGVWKLLQFDGALTLTHNATSLILPGNANITTAAGDMLLAMSEGSGNWRVYWYTKRASVPFNSASVTITGGSVTGITDLAIADGGTGASTAAAAFSNIKQNASTTATGVIQLAEQVNMEAATSSTLAVTPVQMKYSPGVAKAWVNFDGDPIAIRVQHNVTSITDGGVGIYTINFTTAFSGANYAASAMATAINGPPHQEIVTMAAGSCLIHTRDDGGGGTTYTFVDPDIICFTASGDQ